MKTKFLYIDIDCKHSILKTSSVFLNVISDKQLNFKHTGKEIVLTHPTEQWIFV